MRLVACFALVLTACGGAVDSASSGGSSSSSGGRETTTPPSGSSSSSSGASGVTQPTPSEGSCASSLTTPVIEDFEKGLNPTWGSTNAAGFVIDQKQPISGKRSLHASFKGNGNEHLTVRVPSVCKVKVSLSIRFDEEFTKSAATFLQVKTASAWFSFRIDSGALSLMQTGLTKESGYGAPGPSLGSAFADVPFKLTFDLDVIKPQYEVNLVSEGDPSSAPPQKGAATHPSGELVGGITEINIGTAPNIESKALGSFWVDDLRVE